MTFRITRKALVQSDEGHHDAALAAAALRAAREGEYRAHLFLMEPPPAGRATSGDAESAALVFSMLAPGRDALE